MKFLILALVALSFGLSESGELRKYQGPAKLVIKEKYGLTLKQLEKKCSAKNRAYWNDVKQILKFNVDIGEDLACDIAEKADQINKPTNKDFDDLIKKLCLTNTVLLNVKKYITTRIKKCFDENELPDKSVNPGFYFKSVTQTCAEVKLRAMERTPIQPV